MRVLELLEIIAIHDRVIEETGGVIGIRDLGLIQAAVAKPLTALFGAEMYPTIHEKAAVFLEALANYHGFVDGNKRSAFVCAARVLYLNGYDIDAGQDEVVSFMRDVATKKRDLPRIAEWLKRRSVRRR